MPTPIIEILLTPFLNIKFLNFISLLSKMIFFVLFKSSFLIEKLNLSLYHLAKRSEQPYQHL